MTKAESESPFGRQLINMILSTIHDGEIDIREVERLHMLLREGPASMPAVEFLRSHTRDIVADGRVDRTEAYALKKAFERVVPKEARGVIQTHLESIGAPPRARRETEEESWRGDPVTARQVEYILDLGGTVRPGMTKGEASELIDELVDRRPPSPRQVMLLRFFDRIDLASGTKEEVSLWIDQHFAKDERFERIWEQHKRETNHDPYERDPTIIPIGAFRKYIQRKH